MQQVDVECLALDPLTAVQQAAQGGELSVDDGAARVLHGAAGAQLVGDRADPADAGGEVRGSVWARPRRKASKNLGGS